MLKKIFISLLFDCFLIQIIISDTGCAAFYSTKGDNNLSNYRNYDKKMLVILKDKREIEVKPSGLYFIAKDKKYIYGEGKEFNYLSSKESDFVGIIPANKIDSNKIIKNKWATYYLYWTKDKKRFVFKNEDAIRVIPDSVKPFWVVFRNHYVELGKINNLDYEEENVSSSIPDSIKYLTKADVLNKTNYIKIYESNIKEIQLQKINKTVSYIFTAIFLIASLSLVIALSKGLPDSKEFIKRE